MINLLQGNERRQLRLAELLIQKGDWMSLKELAFELNCSERIIKYDFKKFEDVFSDFTIETSRHGVRLIFDDNKGLKNIYLNIFDSSNAFKLLEIIFFNETHSIYELADILFISPSTLYRIIHQINEIISTDGFQVETNPCRIIGAEENIRYFYYQLFFEKYTIMTWPYNQVNYNMVNDLLYFFMDLTEFKADFAYYNIAQLILFINLNRYEKGHYLAPEKTTIDLSDILTKIESSPDNIKYFEKRFKVNINSEFIIQIGSPFIQDGFSFNYNQLINRVEKNKIIAKEVSFLRNLLEEISKENNLLLTNQEEIVFELYNSTYLEKYDPRAGHILYNRNDFFVDAIQKEFPLFYRQVYNGIKEYLILTNTVPHEQNINYLIYVLFTEWKNIVIELERQRDKVSALIISNQNLAHSYMLRDFLSIQFNFYLAIDVYDDTIMTTSILENLDHDLIISNFPIPELRTKESVYIENFPSQNELFQIQKKIDQILANKNS